MNWPIARAAFGFVVAFSSLAVSGCDALRGNGDLVAALPNGSYMPECAAIDDTHVYWTAAGHVFRVPRSGGAIEDFASISGRPVALGALGAEVVFLDQDSGTLYGKAKAGGALRTITVLSSPPSLRCMPEDEQALYASGRGATKTAGSTGFAVTPYAVAVRIDKKTGVVTELVRLADDDLAIAIDATDVYLQSEKNLYAVTRVPKAGGAAQALSARDPRLDPPGSGHSFFRGAPIAVAEGIVYAVGSENGLVPVFMLPTHGGIPAPAKVQLQGTATLVSTKHGACAADAFDITCFDASGKTKRYGRTPMPRWIGVRGDDLYWFGDLPVGLRHAKL